MFQGLWIWPLKVKLGSNIITIELIVKKNFRADSKM